MRLLIATSCVALGAAVSALTVGAAPSPSPGFGSASCLRGQWARARLRRSGVLRALAPVSGLEPTGNLYMIFRDGVFQTGPRRSS